VATLQCNGRISADRAAEVLGVPVRTIQRRLAALLADGTVRVVTMPPRPPLQGVSILRIRLLSGAVETVAEALAARDDVPMIDISASGDELSAVLVARPGRGSRLVFRQLPSTPAVTSVEAKTVLHVFSDAADWRLDALSSDERSALAASAARTERRLDNVDLDDLDGDIADALGDNARMSASEVSRRTGHAESTLRRRIAALFDQGRLRTQVLIDPERLGFHVDANLYMQVPPGALDAAGRSMAAHPAVHGALASTGPANLIVAVWLRDLDHLYEFVTQDLVDLGVVGLDTVVVGQAYKRPGSRAPMPRAVHDRSGAR
jgi:DNA-binding Lrp family transcriptional regulator